MPRPDSMTDEAFEWAKRVDSRVASMTAGSYLALAREIIAELGEEKGKALIRHAMRNWGLQAGRGRRAVAEAKGLPLNRAGYLAAGGDLYSLSWESGAPGRITHCPIAAAWKDMGPDALELGYLFCEVDFAMVEGFNPEFRLQRPRCIALGDDVCQFEFPLKGKAASG